MVNARPHSPELGIASLSLGVCDHHDFPAKVAAAARAGFGSIEIFDNDWDAYRDAYAAERGVTSVDGDEVSLEAARALGALVRGHGMRISCWQPLRSFEGFVDAAKRTEAHEHARAVLSLLPALGTDLILVCSNKEPSPITTGDLATCAADLAWLADEGAKYDPPLRVSYEGLSFAAHRRTWADAYEVVVAANRPNVGLALDSFNTLAYEWADPYSPTGKLDPEVDARLEKSLAKLAQVPGDKIFFLQVADAERMTPPLTPPEDPTIPRLLPWSREHRLFPLETSRGAYMPVVEFCEAVVRTGYSGPWSIEVFNASLHDPADTVPDEHARRALEGLRGVVQLLLGKAAIRS